MVEKILFYTLMICNFINMTHLGLYVIGANIYDIKKFKQGKTATKKARSYGKPLVSVIVPAHNESVGVERTLNSILANSYSNVEIIVVDDGSTDDTVDVVRNYIKQLKKSKVTDYMSRRGRTNILTRQYIREEVSHANITLVRQPNQGKAAAMNNAIKNHATGKLVMCLDGDSVLKPHAIENAVKYFRDRRVMGVAANVRVMDNGSLLGRLQRFEHMIGYRSKKFYTLTNTEFIVGGVASTYRMSVLKQVGYYDTDTMTEDIGLSMKLIALKGNRKFRIVYGADVVAMTEGVQTYKQLMRQRYRWKMGSLQNLLKYNHVIVNGSSDKYGYLLTLYRLPMAFLSEAMLIIEPIILGYIIFLSIYYRTPAILLGAYVTITLYILWTVWPDEHLSNKEKFAMSFQALQIYILFYAMDLVQLSAIYKCLRNRKEIVNRNSLTTWTSPTRAGQAASIVQV